ncbi:ABC transporter ATP-binding protein [bacterium]|nr:ABC transporter ATP-binding protein [bacterium]
MEIELINISKSYQEGGRKHSILNEISVRFPANRFSAILGKSGSGKSTLLNLISGIDTPDKGSIRIGNQMVNTMNDYQRTIFRRNRIGFVFQFFNLIPTLTVLENVVLMSELDGNNADVSRNAAEQILSQVGLGNRLDATPDRLSGGEQQRTAIARALVHNPDIILADEPTGNLDHDTGLKVLDLMLKLINEKGKTLVIATHSDEIQQLANHVFTISSGKLDQLT